MNGTTATVSAPDAASQPPPFSALAAAGLGVAFHVVSQNFELDDHGWRLIGGFNALFFSAIVASVYFLGNGITAAISQVVPLAASVLAGLYTSIAIRRLFLSPLRKFPGPWQARLTKFYHMWLQSKNMQLMVEIEKMHDQYGDFVRTGPRELSIRRASAIPLIYGAKSVCRKAPWYKHTEFNQEDVSLVNIIDIKEHNKRRRVFDQGFSSKALATYEPRVQAKVDTLLAKFSAHAGRPINVTDWTSYFSFDVMGDVLYSKEYNMLHAADGRISANGKHVTLAALHAGMKMFGLLGTVPWAIRMLSQAGLAGDFGIMREWCRGAMRDRQKAFDPAVPPADAASHLLANAKQSPQSLLQDSILLVVAGSDTTSSAAAHALYRLATNPAVYARLQKLLATAEGASISGAAAAYLDAIINETLRLAPPACEGLLRETPPAGLTIDGVHIPGGTVVSVPTWAVQRDGRAWSEPNEWRPERWESVGNPNVNEGAAWLPFSRGAYSCPGKGLAYVELRRLIAGVAGRFELELVEGGRGFEEGVMDTFSLTNRELWVVFRERGRGA